MNDNGRLVQTATEENNRTLTYGCGNQLQSISGNNAEAVTYDYDGELLTGINYSGDNHLGSLRAVADSNGTIVKEVTYDSFGTILNDSNENLHVNFGFAGGLYDPDTKLMRFGYRDYDAQTGKWTAKDPIGFNGGDTNLYGYVLNDPVNFIDPWGLLPWSKEPAFVPGGVGGNLNPNLPFSSNVYPLGIPKNWAVRPSKKGGGTQYYNPNNPRECIRVMPGNPNSPNPAQQRPYYKATGKDGQYYDQYGNKVNQKSPESHIPFH